MGKYFTIKDYLKNNCSCLNTNPLHDLCFCEYKKFEVDKKVFNKELIDMLNDL